MSPVNHLLSAGTTNQSARGVAVARIASSKDAHVVSPEASLSDIGGREFPVLLRSFQSLHEPPFLLRARARHSSRPGRDSALLAESRRATYESAGYRSADAFRRDDANIDVCASLHLPSYSLT